MRLNLKRFFLSIPIVLFIISLVGCNNQKSTKELYELQEKCGKRCEAFYNNKEQTDIRKKEEGYTLSSSYKCHYSKKMGKCFIRITTAQNIYGENGTKTGWDIINVNENKVVGDLYDDGKTTMCSFNTEEKGKNWGECLSLVKPYMEE